MSNARLDAVSTYRYEKFKWNHEKIQEFHNAMQSDFVQSCFSEAMALIEIDINESLCKFNEGLSYAGNCMKQKIFVGNEKKKKWFDIECRENRKYLRQKLRKFYKSNSEHDKLTYLDKRKEYKELLKTKKTENKKKILDSLCRHKEEPKQFWSTLRSVKTRQPLSNSISSNAWLTYFQNVFQSNIVENCTDNFVHESIEENDVLNQMISEDEVLAAARFLKNDKAAGPDGLIGEFYKFSIDEIKPFLTKLFNVLFSRGLFPDSWTESIIQPLYKKGDKALPDSYRGISLLNICGKMYSFILNKRLTKWIEENELIGEEQAGFRKKYSTVDQIFTLTALIQKQLLRHRKLYVAFIDFRKAFDSVSRNKLWNVLLNSGVNGKMLRALQSMYKIVKARVRVGSNMTECFLCPRGLKQGEICSPVLFSLFINELTKEIVSNGLHGIQLTPDLLELFIILFADDVALFSDTVIGLQKQLNILSVIAKRLDLVINLEKSDIVVFRNGGHIASKEKWFFDSTEMNVVNVYKYLGIFLSTKLSYTYALEDLASRGKKAVIAVLKTLWSLDDHSYDVFFKIFDCQVQPILSYGSEIWALSGDLQIVERVHLFAIKRFLGVSARTPGTIVYGETGRYPLFINMYCKCIRYWLKLTRMNHNRLPKKAYAMLLNLHTQNFKTWALEICYILYKYGFGVAWENQGVGSIRLFMCEFKRRLFDHYDSEWKERLMSNEKFLFISTFKQSFTVSHYLLHVKYVHARSALARFRCGMSPVRARALRFSYNNTDDEFYCPFCTCVFENEVHFMFICPMYFALRQKYIPLKFYRRPSLSKLSILLASVNPKLINDVALYVYHALNVRSSTIENL